MRNALRLLAVAIASVGTALWFFGGMNAGPTRIGATETVLDPATGRPVDIRRPDFRPGPRFLATCLTIAGVLGAASLAPAMRTSGKPPYPTRS
jgi:hypothetical protein